MVILDKIWLYGFYIWIILIVIISIIFYGFHHCNGSCYFTNDFVGSIALPFTALFAFWTIGLVPLGILAVVFDKKGESVND